MSTTPALSGNKYSDFDYVHIDTSVSPSTSKHEFACISMAAVHTDTSSVWVTCEFHSYEHFLCRSCFYANRRK